MFKPMLACSTIPDIYTITLPKLMSPKIDGIRCLIIDGIPVSRTLKLIPNKFIQGELRKLNLPKLDGELRLSSGADFSSVQSAVMSVGGCPDFEFVVFDYFENPEDGYSKRIDDLCKLPVLSERVMYVGNTVVCDIIDMRSRYNKWLAEGYEGAIVRDPKAKYKFGRSTLKQQWMLKLKLFEDAEAMIIGFKELMHNENYAGIDNVGNQTRSSHKEGKVAGDTLGSLACVMLDDEGKPTEIKFNVAGFSKEKAKQIWEDRHNMWGDILTFKYQGVTPYGIPRFPVFKSFREGE